AYTRCLSCGKRVFFQHDARASRCAGCGAVHSVWEVEIEGHLASSIADALLPTSQPLAKSAKPTPEPPAEARPAKARPVSICPHYELGNDPETTPASSFFGGCFLVFPFGA